MTGILKKYIVYLAACSFYYTGIAGFWLWFCHVRGRRGDICALGMHRVLSEHEAKIANSLPGIVLREKTFAGILEYLQSRFAVVSVEEFLSPQAEGRKRAKPRCLMTFDDAWRDNFTTALPILRKYRMPAVIFAVTGLVDTLNTFWVERLARRWKTAECRQKLIAAFAESSKSGASEATFEEIVEKLKHLPAAKREQVLDALPGNLKSRDSNDEGDRMFTWSEAKKLQNEGVEIEAHSVTHPLLVYEDDEAVVRELSESKRVLEEKLGKRVRAFAYPNGTWDQRVRKRVEEAGYECAFTTEKGWYRPGSDRFTIRRIMLHEGMVTGPNGKFSPALLSLRLSGLI